MNTRLDSPIVNNGYMVHQPYIVVSEGIKTSSERKSNSKSRYDCLEYIDLDNFYGNKKQEMELHSQNTGRCHGRFCEVCDKRLNVRAPLAENRERRSGKRGLV